MAKEIKFANEAREKMIEGIKILHDAVSVTLGPKGRNVIIAQEYGFPLIVNDGVTIAKQIELEDPYQNLGASILIEAATKTNDVVGDGTSSAIVVATSLIIEGMNEINKGYNPVLLRKGFNYYLPLIIEMIKQKSKEIETYEDIDQIALISSQDEEIAQVIKECYQSVGKNGVINVEESQGIEIKCDIVLGYSYDRGYLSPYMVNNEDKMMAELDNPQILITDKKIISMNELIPFLEVTMKNGRPLFIICDDIEQEVLNALVVNKLRGVLNVVVTKAPAFGEKKTNILNDLAVLTNCHFANSSLNLPLSLENNSLGTATKVKVSKDETIIIGSTNKDQVEQRITKLQAELKDTKSEYEREKLQERIAKLTTGVAIISVGAGTELELKEKKLRIEDAVCATRAALQSGVIEGGGKVFYEISQKLDKYSEHLVARTIIQKALKKPFYQIVSNAGANLDEIEKQINHQMWYDATKDQVIKYKNAGIIDPTSVEIAVITSAISIAGTFLTTECAIVDQKDHQLKKEISEDNLL